MMAKKATAKSDKKVAKSAQKLAKKKSTKVKKPAAANDAVPAVRVRMFRQGLGDCFLLTFDLGGNEKHILIDCGTLGNRRTQVKIADVGKEIHTTVANGKLDAVVATHEHQDHLSGFRQSELKKFEGKVGNVWLAWTENPEDEDAKKFVRTKDDLGQALAAIALHAAETPMGQQIAHLLGFAGTVPGMDDLGNASANVSGSSDQLGVDFARSVHESMEFVRLNLSPMTRYCNPGETIEEDWLPGFRIYVLGPPRDRASISDRGSHDSEELYHIANSLRIAARLHFTADDTSPGEQAEYERELPFDKRYISSGDELIGLRYQDYTNSANEWRRIDTDWLNAATDLALQLDKLTNNSSLALAIERIVDGKVLLFPADAQQGNWLSWHKLEWKIAGETKSIRIEDLLKRTVFYKVGHHASHNATLREKGLELMPKDKLTAFIPVDRAIALNRHPTGAWQMPAFHLYRRLMEMCGGRVARSDVGWAAMPHDDDTVEEEFRALATEREWEDWGANQRAAERDGQVTITNKFIDYILT